MRLPLVMEEVMELWDAARIEPQFKCEYTVSTNITASLEQGARVTAKRMGLSGDATKELVERFLGYAHEIKGPDAKPVPPILFCVTKDSRDHSVDSYKNLVMPLFSKMDPAPLTALTHLQAGVHSYWTPEKDLAMGVAPSAAKLWHDAVTMGYFS